MVSFHRSIGAVANISISLGLGFHPSYLDQKQTKIQPRDLPCHQTAPSSVSTSKSQLQEPDPAKQPAAACRPSVSCQRTLQRGSRDPAPMRCASSKKDGLLERKPGRRHFCERPAGGQAIAIDELFSEDMRERGLVPSSEILSVVSSSAPTPSLAQKLKLVPGARRSWSCAACALPTTSRWRWKPSTWCKFAQGAGAGPRDA